MRVNSSTIAEISHDGKTLTVVFNNGREYDYEGVPASIFESFCNAASKGRYFHENINGRYNYSRIK